MLFTLARPHRAGAAACALGGLALAALVSASDAASAADAVAGQALATRWCAACHVVGEGAQSAASDAPTFATIANRTGDVSASWLAFRLLNPHPQMPQVSLTRTQAADLAAYLATLKK
ncbi:cytochrome c [Xanthobacter sp. KR7-65]|uniref:c-type cytochrome n=1 Tax=Xanthobacter sp. KR7-65 TaxID=3156612 RepID=UPI0032B4DA4E